MNPYPHHHGSAGSAGSARMQSMLDGSSFAPQEPPAAHSAAAPLPLANSAAAPSSTDLPAIMDGIDGGQSAGGPSAGQPQAENGEEPVLRTAVSAAELREKVLAARKVVFAGRKARVSFFSFCYPHQRRRRGYNRAETRMRWWICSSRCLALILLMPPLKAIAVMKKPAAAGAAEKLKTVSPPEHNPHPTPPHPTPPDPTPPHPTPRRFFYFMLRLQPPHTQIVIHVLPKRCA